MADQFHRRGAVCFGDGVRTSGRQKNVRCDIVVSPDGSTPFKTIQSALDSIPENNTDPRVIVLKPGVYKEHLQIPKLKPFITFHGEDSDPTKAKITYDRHSGMDDPEAPGKKVGTSGSESVLILADDFTAENVTFANSAGDIGQAVAVRTTSDRVAFHNCRLIGWQDTLYVNGKRTYFDHCYIEGRADFIFGRATAVFDHCEIHSKNGGYQHRGQHQSGYAVWAGVSGLQTDRRRRARISRPALEGRRRHRIYPLRHRQQYSTRGMERVGR